MPKVESKEIELPVAGLDSEHCALVIEKGLKEVSALKYFRIEVNNKRVIVEVENTQVLKDVVDTIRNLGYEVSTRKKSVPVLEMTCASCASGVENILNNQKGVAFASVNYANSTAHIEYLPEKISLEVLQKAVQDGGYDLVVEESSSEEDSIDNIHKKRYQKLKRKTILALILALPVVVIGMFFMDMPYANPIMLVLTTPVIFWLGRDFYINAWKQARYRTANMDTLVALSTGVAYLFSVFNMAFPNFWGNLDAHVYFEAAAVIIAFILLGKLLEERAKGSASSAIQKLMGLQPKTLTLVQDDNHQVTIPVSQVAVGNIILVKPGEKIALDGRVISGETYVDESMLSGEPLPILKSEGAKVFAGSINQKGSLKFEVEKVGEDTMLSQIIKMVQDAQGSKAPVQRLVDKIAGIFVPVVIGIALIAFVVWNVLGGENGFTYGLLALITVLVIACPCALGLATPTAIMVGVGKGAENGILIKDAESLEVAKNVNAVILDKTGTITEGNPQVTEAFWKHEDGIIKQILHGLERQSEHPLADALTTHLDQYSPVQLEHFTSITGMGVEGVYQGKTYYAGNIRLLNEKGLSVPEAFLNKANAWSQEAKTIVWFAKENEVLAIFAIADPIKSSSRKAIQDLQKQNIEVYMLTGDNEATASVVAASVGISRFQAECLPKQKADFVKELQAQGKIVAMVGDGINDSAALAQANLSIAMGKGSDIAMDVAKMTIISSDLVKISQAIQLSKATVKTLRQNLFWAFIYNLIGIPIAAGVLYPINGFLLNPMLAGGAMAMSSVSVVTNSLRLYKKN